MEGKSMTGNSIFITSGGGGGGGTYTASSPIQIDGADNISLTTVPVSKGGTGFTTVGAANTVLTSNGSILSWTPITTGGTVTSVTATAPLVTTGTSVAPIINLQANPTITNPTLITPTLGVATSTSLTATNLIASRLLIADGTKKITSISGAGANGEILTISSGAPIWTAPATAGTVTSVGLSVPSIFTLTGTNPITSSGTFTLDTATTPEGTGAIVLKNSPTLVTPNIGAATGSSIVLTNAGANGIFGPASSAASSSNIQVRNTGSTYNELAVAGGTAVYSSSALQGDSILRAIGGKLLLQTGSGTASIAIDSSNNVTLATTVTVSSLSVSRLVTTDASKVLTSLATGTDGQVLTLASGAPVWQSASPFAGSFTASTTSNTVGTLNVTNTNGVPRCLFSALAPSMSNTSQFPFAILTGRAAATNASAVATYSTDSITVPTALGSSLTLGLYGTSGMVIRGDNVVTMNAQAEQAVIFTGGNLRPAYLGVQYSGSNFGTILSMGVNQVGTIGGSVYNAAQQGGRYSIRTEAGATHTWEVKTTASSTNTVSMTLNNSGNLEVVNQIISGSIRNNGNYSQTSTGVFEVDSSGVAGGRLRLDTAGNLAIAGILASLSSYAYYVSNSSGAPNATWQNIGGWGALSTRGYQLDLYLGQVWLNNIGKGISIVCHYSGRRNTNGFGTSQFRLYTSETSGANTTYWANSKVTATDYITISGHIFIPPGYQVGIQGYQDSGSGNDWVDGKFSYIIH